MQPNIIIKNNANYEKTILVVGVFHGDEPQGEFFIEEYLKKCDSAGKNRLFFLPRLNSTSTRKNENGVDLNRNFPTKNWELTNKNDEYYGGNTPESELQTRFLTKLIAENKFDAIITIHSPYKVINFDPNSPHTLQLAGEVSKILNYPLQNYIGYPTPGSFGTYCGIERGIATITIEIDEEVEPKFLLEKFFNLFDYLKNVY